MSILGRQAILEEIRRGNIIIEPFNESMLGPASVDLHLSNAFRVFVHLPTELHLTDDMDFKAATKGFLVPPGQDLIIQPGQTVLGITQEKITTRAGIAGWLEGRSRFARVGLLVHISASFMQPGIANHQVLEISNFGPIPLRIIPGTAICQFIFTRCEGAIEYKGVFAGQTPTNFCHD
ncbi:MAG: Deoxycytidine triphosphate deaminase [Candidatus Ozemobacter sibiricus]|uniref:Deoxycytidine triphosphate deaminase n=1 Tax=Candidatus Ozemobacter sibiricus TaxID=2268124 RepID=A0A367ZQU3_9BACT|nr:MAG: Deoxycytidine triphosphate deaminase [Candidatus Ozemobacter sibiricus]